MHDLSTQLQLVEPVVREHELAQPQGCSITVSRLHETPQ